MPTLIATWETGQTKGVMFGEAISASTSMTPIKDAWFVTSNGELWTALYVTGKDKILETYYRLNLITPTDRGYRTTEGTIFGLTKSRLDEERLKMLTWASRLNLKDGETQQREAIKPKSDMVLPRKSGAKIKYVKFHSVEKKLPYTLAQIHSIIDEALSLCESTWRWSTTDASLEVWFHETGKSMGLAYEPGRKSIELLKTRKISLHKDLLRFYDRDAIARTVLHEYCHHYREETWPRSAIKYRGIDLSHDEQFCESLAKVDPLVSKDPKTCSKFYEECNEDLVAIVEEKREENISWSTKDGKLNVSVLKTGKMSMQWVPTGTKRWRKMAFVLGPNGFVELIERIGSSNIKDVAVEPDARVQGFLELKTKREGPWSLADVIRVYVEAYKSLDWSRVLKALGENL